MRPSFPKINASQTILLTVFLAVLVTIVGTFLENLSFPDSSYNFLGKTREVRLEPEKSVTQVFRAKENHLNQIKVMAGNLDLRPREKLVFELADSGCGETMAQSTYRFYHFDPHIYYRLNFPEIPNSQGQEYCLRITYHSPFDRGRESPFVDATDDEEPAFMGWSYYDGRRDQVYENKTLKMRPAYGTGSFWGDLKMLNNRLSQYKPEFIKGWILPLLGSLITGSTVLAVWIIRSREEKES